MSSEEPVPKRASLPEALKPTPTAPPASTGPAADPAVPRPPVGRRLPDFPPSVPRPPPGLTHETMKVDKYFGTKLPPVCRQLGCYVTDNGRFYYCVNPNCHKDKKRETKHTRRWKNPIYFSCPKCRSREIQLHLMKNQYECLECAYAWRR